VNARVSVVAAVQLNSSEDVAANLAAVESGVARAAAAGARLVLLPENFAFFGAATERARHAERAGDEGATVQATLAALARRCGVAIVAGGHPEVAADPGRPYNSALAFAADGSLVGCYRKRHLFDVELPDGARYEESRSTTPGDALVVVEIAGLRCGLSICYDLRFPEHYRALVAAGAELLLVPAAFTRTTGADHFSVLLRARAIENQCWVVAANQWGVHPGGRETFGHSCVIDPWGRVVADAGEGVGVVSAHVDLDQLQELRQRLPALAHRRDRDRG